MSRTTADHRSLDARADQPRQSAGFSGPGGKGGPADLGEVLSSLDEEDRLKVVKALPARLSGAALVEMGDENQAEETLENLGRGFSRGRGRNR